MDYRGLHAAFAAGVSAGRRPDGSVALCPYEDSFRCARRTAWMKGFKLGAIERSPPVRHQPVTLRLAVVTGG